ncbi:MAG: hypothetical protein R3Y28_05745 [Candidatus Gastranaerophilales bacterium]
MGMAASQARYIALSARKSNAEYEGQQINQARTALANQSSAAFTEMLALEVPTAPNTTDYTTTQYSFTEGTYDQTISSMSELENDPDGYNYLVSHYTYADVYTGVESMNSNPQVVTDSNGDPISVGNKELSAYDSTDATQEIAYNQILSDFPDSTFASSSSIYTYEKDGVTYFTCEEDLLTSANSGIDPTNPSENQSALTQYNAESLETKIETTEKAFIDFNDSGRAESIKFEDSSAVYTLNTETLTDTDAYDDAMNQYEYNVQVYNKAIADINAETEMIQQEDLILELELSALDTEQNALQTEMESVKSVIEKNIENTFNTFQ